MTTTQPNGLAHWIINHLRSRETRKANRHLRAIETLPLGGRRSLTLVLCDGERFLVGGGADRIESIVRVGPIPAAETPCA